MAYITKINVKGTTYNIKSSYDDNTAHNFADIYDSAHSGAYAVGDLVVYDGTLYECTTATSNPPGAFDSSKWSEVTVEGEFKRIQTAVTGNPTSSGTATAFVTNVTQNAQGVIVRTAAGLPFSSTAPSAPGTASAGSANTIARGDHIHPLQTTISGNAGTATTLQTPRKIDGVSFDGSADIIHYGVSSSLIGDIAKTVACTSYNLVNGAKIAVKFTNGNTALGITLNVNSTGAKQVKYKGNALATDTSVFNNNSVYEFVYDSTDDCYHMIGDANWKLNAALITSGTLPVTRGGTGSGGDSTPFLGDSIIVTNATGTQLVSDNTISMDEFHALNGVKTNVTIQDQIDAITGGGTDHVRYINEVPLWAVAGQQGYQFTLAKVVNGYNSSTNPDGYKVDIGDTIIGKDGTVGVVEAKTGTEGNYTFTAYYKDKLNMLDATYTSGTETLNLVLITPQGNPT